MKIHILQVRMTFVIAGQVEITLRHGRQMRASVEAEKMRRIERGVTKAREVTTKIMAKESVTMQRGFQKRRDRIAKGFGKLLRK